MGLDLGESDRQIRPPPHRYLPPPAPRSRDAPPPELGLETVLRCLGTARWAESFRRSQDLDHWASFHDSFAAMVGLIRDVASGKKGDPPSTVLILSGDVHHGYLAEAKLDKGTKSHVYQAVCSPLRNALPKEKSFLQSNAWTGLAALTGRFLARLARIPHEPI